VLYEERRRKHEAELLCASGGKADEELLRRPFNYIVDKGWRESLEAFCRAVVTGEKSDNAAPLDAAWATLIANAANQSNETGVSVKVDAGELGG